MPMFACASPISRSRPPEEPINDTLEMSTTTDKRTARRSQIILLLVKKLLFFHLVANNNKITTRNVPETAASTVHVCMWINKTPISKVEKAAMSKRRPDRKYLKRNAIDT